MSKEYDFSVNALAESEEQFNELEKRLEDFEKGGVSNKLKFYEMENENSRIGINLYNNTLRELCYPSITMKVRNVDGFLEQVEDYIRKEYEARVSLK